MKLTNSMRDAFVRAAVDDVPQVDYQSQLSDMAVKFAVANLPPPVRALYKTAPSYINQVSRYVDEVGCLAFPGESGATFSMDQMAQLREIASKRDDQKTKLRDLRSKLRAVAYSATTRKQQLEMLPEFEKYLPEDAVAANRSVPAIANVVSEFVQAGWPKGAAKPKAKSK